MKISLSWINYYLTHNIPITDLVDGLTTLGVEVENTEYKNALYQVYVQDVLDIGLRVRLCKVIFHGKIIDVLCGASDVIANRWYLYAPVGTHFGDKTVSIKKIKNFESYGFLMAQAEFEIYAKNKNINKILSWNIDPNSDLVYWDIEHNRTDIVCLEDVILNVVVPSNRADLMSIRGVVRELHSYFKDQTELKSNFYDVCNHQNVKSGESIQIINNSDCVSNFMIIKNIHINDTMRQLLKSINKESSLDLQCLNDFILLDTGCPIAIYDLQHLQSNKLEYRVEEYKINVYGDKLLGTVGEKTILGFNDETTNILIEYFYLKPQYVEAIKSDSARIFAAGVDYNINPLNYIHNIVEGDMQYIEINILEIDKKQVFVSINEIKSILGFEILISEMTRLLKNFGFDNHVDQQDDIGLLITIPSWRTDIRDSRDIIEEIVRIIDRNQYLKTPMIDLDIKNTLITNDLETQIINRLVHFGFFELKHLTLTNSGSVEIINPLLDKYQYLRDNLFDGLYNHIYQALLSGSWGCKFFEIGKVYKEINNQYIEIDTLGMIMGGKLIRNYRKQQKFYDFFDFKEIFYSLSDLINIKEIDFSHGILLENGYIAIINNGYCAISQKKFNILDCEVFYAEIQIIPSKLDSFRSDKLIKKDIYIISDKKWFEIEKIINHPCYLFDKYENKYGITLMLNIEDKEQIQTIIDNIMSKFS